MQLKVFVFLAMLILPCVLLGYWLGHGDALLNQPAMSYGEEASLQLAASPLLLQARNKLQQHQQQEKALQQEEESLQRDVHALQLRYQRVSALAASAIATTEDTVPDVAVNLTPMQKKFIFGITTLTQDFGNLTEEQLAAYPKSRQLESYVTKRLDKTMPLYLLFKSDLDNFVPMILDQLATEENPLVLQMYDLTFKAYFKIENKPLPDPLAKLIVSAMGTDMPPANQGVFTQILVRTIRSLQEAVPFDKQWRRTYTGEKKDIMDLFRSSLLKQLQQPFQRGQEQNICATMVQVLYLEKNDSQIQQAVESYVLKLPVPTQEDREQQGSWSFTAGETISLKTVYLHSFRAVYSSSGPDYEQARTFFSEHFVGQFDGYFDADLKRYIPALREESGE